MAEVTDKTTYKVTAKRWKHGWELHIDDIGVTQSRTLLDADAMVRDYVAMLLDIPETSFDVEVAPEIGAGVDGEIVSLYEADRAAKRAQERAAEKRRSVAQRLKVLGLSGREIAAVLKISPQRVSQLLDKGERPRRTGRSKISS
jgi:DNA-directed RNA polymerase specialized sigma24 family protein